MGRKAALLGWADAQGLATPGGLVVPAERFWAALEACGARGQARYLESSALRLDPSQALAVAASISAAMAGPALEAAAAEVADAACPALGPPPLVCRSSSAMEDGRAAAFPGVFTSVLDIGTPAALAAAVATCWRSAFSPAALGYVVRMASEPLDLSLALLLQRQVPAAWYGVYVSVDPVTGAGEPLADLSTGAPDALVAGGPAAIRARRVHGRWTGIDAAPTLEPALESVRRAGRLLGQRLASEVDVEFAVPAAGADPVILQCRPLTSVGGGPVLATTAAALRGRPCAGGRAAGRVNEPGGIAVVEHLTPADYGLVLGHAGVVMERDASPLSHVAVLCRELGVPFVCGVADARAKLAGRRVVVDGSTGTVEIEIVASSAPSPSAAAPPAPAEPAMSAVELVLRVLAEAGPGQAPEAVAEQVLGRYSGALGGGPVRVVTHALDPEDEATLDRLGAQLLGPGFSAAALLDKP